MTRSLGLILFRLEKCRRIFNTGETFMGNTSRVGEIHRKTQETDIRVNLKLDGLGTTSIRSGVSFMDHMLTLFGVHGFFDLDIEGAGDIEVDYHHTVEDLGICLGQAFKSALGDLSGICRYGFSAIPMDEALAQVTVDISNRPYLYFSAPLKDQKVGTFDTALAKEFLRALSLHAGLTLHIKVEQGDNAHHIIEAVFKALGRALGQAVSPEPRSKGPLSSKGSL
jgi:imidazoleglycerol-phosphate dehydratase